MNTHAEKTHENKSQLAASKVSRAQGSGELTFQFVDKRPEAVAQRKLQEMANNSPLVKRAAQLQALVNSYTPQQQKPIQKQENKTINNSSNTVIQRTPEEWAVDSNIIRMLNRPHGWFSTWKKIKAKINEYLAFSPEAQDARKAKLDEIKPLIAKWEANKKHTAASRVQRVQDIRLDIPILQNLIAHEYTQIEDAILDNYYTGIIGVNQGIPVELTDGIARLTTDGQKANRLFQNINNFRFRYTGQMVNSAVAFTAHQGDCQTLVGMYRIVAEALNIPFEVGILNARQLVSPRAIHGRETTSNTEGGTDWYFKQHFWAIGAETAYDVLFMSSPQPASIVTNGSDVHNGVTYYTFADGRCVIEPDQDALNYQIQGEGRVFADDAATIAFINAHH